MMFLLDRLGRAGPRITFDRVVRSLPIAAAAIAITAVALVEVKVWRTPQFAYAPIVVKLAAVVFVGVSLLALVLPRLAPRELPSGTADARTSWLLSLELGLLLLVGPVFLVAKGVPEDEMTMWMLPLVNKRWLLALYYLAIATFVILPVAVHRWRSNDIVVSSPDIQTSPRSRRALASLVAQLGLIGLCWYLAGPPWHLERHHRVVDWHEQLHFGGLQAISRGYLPFIGPAATPYGPGGQLLLYGLMKGFGSFDLVGFRTAWAAQNFLGALVVAEVAYFSAGFLSAVIIVLLAFTYSPLAFFFTSWPDGTYAGFYGWANALRYATPLIVVPALVPVAMARDERSILTVLLGVVWGIGAYYGQEGLTATAIAAGTLLALLWLTRTISLRRATRIGVRLIVGFLCVAAPILGYYAWRGAAGDFVRAYFFFAHAMAIGFAGSWWYEAANPERFSYYLTTPALIACAVCALWYPPTGRLVSPLDRRRATFLAFVAVFIASYPTALLRSDSSHLRNTMIALPFVLVMGFVEIPRWVTTSGWSRILAHLAFAVVALAVYPTVRRVVDSGPWRAPALRFETGSQAAPASDDRIAYRRMTPLLANEPELVQESVPVREFLEFATEVHDIVGPRKTYYLQIGWTTSGGLIAFMADLMPAPHPIGGEEMNLYYEMKVRVADHIRAHPHDYEAFIGPSLSDPEAIAFLDSHPGAARLERRLGKSIVHILLAPL